MMPTGWSVSSLDNVDGKGTKKGTDMRMSAECVESWCIFAGVDWISVSIHSRLKDASVFAGYIILYDIRIVFCCTNVTWRYVWAISHLVKNPQRRKTKMIRTFQSWKMQRSIHARNASYTNINDKIMWPSRATGQPTSLYPGPILTSILLGRWTIGESCEKFHYGDRTSQYFATEAKGQTVHAKRSTGNCNWPDNE